MAKRFGLCALMILGGVLAATPVFAADKSDSGDDSSSSADKAGEGDADKKSEGDADKAEGTDADKEATKEDAKVMPEGAPSAESSPVEDPNKTYNFVGARFRAIIVPQFIVGMFADGAKTVVVPAGGPEFGVRKAGFEFNFSLWLASYGMGATPFKAKSDGEDAWELVESNIKVLYLTSDFLWSHSFNPQLAINYGMGAGLGVVWGPLKRNQAYRDPAASNGFSKCPSPGFRPVCGTDNNHYGNYEEPSWANGGSKPIVFPWLALQTGLRYKPHKKFVGRLDAGFGLSGFFIGLGADYGL